MVLGVLFNIILDDVYKPSRFFKVFPKKNLKFVPYKKGGSVTFDLSLILLSVEVDLIPEKWGYKKCMFVAFGFSDFKMVLGLSTEIVIFYVEVSKV